MNLDRINKLRENFGDYGIEGIYVANLTNVRYLTGFTGSAGSVLILEDGKKFFGTGFGYPGIKVGEVCFNTSMSGYQEIITDPSYNAQIITFTFPHIGNVGTNLDDYESSKSFASGIITREPPSLSSNWRSENEFENWLIKMKLTGI